MSKQDVIAQSYRELVVERNSSQIPVADICARSKVSRTTFYKNFEDRYKIVEYTILQDAVIDCFELLNDPKIDVESVVLNWYLSFYPNKKFYMIAIDEMGQNSLFETIIDTLDKNNKMLIQSRFPEKAEQDIDYYSYKMAATQAMLLKKWFNDGMRASPKDMTRYFLDTLIK
ncbi:MAG: TetR/AcrR family transcriptional regulator [Corallococcus sp.]|nr:TetR/AcrR family transcriptional regulator [Bacillota bacterium]MCM1533296.1 TetR/AcrR family transcriptional regulator [Corallococcus sp.]